VTRCGHRAGSPSIFRMQGFRVDDCGLGRAYGQPRFESPTDFAGDRLSEFGAQAGFDTGCRCEVALPNARQSPNIVLTKRALRSRIAGIRFTVRRCVFVNGTGVTETPTWWCNCQMWPATIILAERSG
jgi:hypothetical protein